MPAIVIPGRVHPGIGDLWQSDPRSHGAAWTRSTCSMCWARPGNWQAIQSTVADTYLYDSFRKHLADHRNHGKSIPLCEAERAIITMGIWAQFYLRARQYSPATGRFQSRDPVSLQSRILGAHRLDSYVYALSNPMAFTDPLGLDAYLRPMLSSRRTVDWGCTLRSCLVFPGLGLESLRLHAGGQSYWFTSDTEVTLNDAVLALYLAVSSLASTPHARNLIADMPNVLHLFMRCCANDALNQITSGRQYIRICFNEAGRQTGCNIEFPPYTTQYGKNSLLGAKCTY